MRRRHYHYRAFEKEPMPTEAVWTQGDLSSTADLFSKGATSSADEWALPDFYARAAAGAARGAGAAAAPSLTSGVMKKVKSMDPMMLLGAGLLAVAAYLVLKGPKRAFAGRRRSRR